MSDTERKQLEEKERRWQRVREFMKGKGLDVLVVMGSHSRNAEPLDQYLSHWVPGNIVIFPLEGEPTLLVSMIPEMLALRPDTPCEERPWVQDIRAGARGAAIVAVLQEKGLERARVGVIGLGSLGIDWEGWVPYSTWKRVVDALPHCNFQEVTTDFAELILIKSDEELRHVRQGANLLEQACREMLLTVRPGATELDVYAAVQKVLCQQGAYAPMVILRSGPNVTSWGEPPWLFGIGSPRLLKPGDIVLAELFAWFGGLEAQVQMAVGIPPISPFDSECAQLARRAYEEGLRHLQPGKTFAEVVAAMESALDRPDVWHLTPLIHTMNPMVCIGPTGVRITSLPGIEAYRHIGTGRIRSGNLRLEPGMVFEFEPNACIKGHRMNIGGTVVLTKNGAEPLNELPSRMRLVGDLF